MAGSDTKGSKAVIIRALYRLGSIGLQLPANPCYIGAYV